MLKVKMLDTGEIKEVTRNVAFGLVDSGKAKYWYENRQMESKPAINVKRAGKMKQYKTK